MDIEGVMEKQRCEIERHRFEYRAKLDKMGMKYTYVETEGGHTWTNWRVYLSQFAPLLFQ